MAINVSGTQSMSGYIAASDADAVTKLKKLQAENPTLSPQELLLKLEAELSSKQTLQQTTPSGAMNGVTRDVTPDVTRDVAQAAQAKAVAEQSAVVSMPVYGLVVPDADATASDKVAALSASLETKSENLTGDIKNVYLLFAELSIMFSQSEQKDSAIKTAMAVALKKAAAQDTRDGTDEKFAMAFASSTLQIVSGTVALAATSLAADDLKSASAELTSPPKVPIPVALDVPEPVALIVSEPVALDVPEPAALDVPEPAALDVPEPAALDVPEPAGQASIAARNNAADPADVPSPAAQAAVAAQNGAADPAPKVAGSGVTVANNADEPSSGQLARSGLYGKSLELKLAIGQGMSSALNGAGGIMNAYGEKVATEKNADAQDKQAIATQVEAYGDSDKSRKNATESLRDKVLDAVNSMTAEAERVKSQIASNIHG